MQRRHFTLIELLVVIAIIAIIFSLLLTGLSRVRDRGMVALCLSNLSNAGKASVQFRTERKRYPDLVDGTQYGWVGKTPIAASSYKGTGITKRLLNKYLGSIVEGDPVLVGQCPADNWSRLSLDGKPTATSSYDWTGSSYAANIPGSVEPGAPPTNNLVKAGGRGVLPSEIKFPARMIEMIEYGGLDVAWHKVGYNHTWIKNSVWHQRKTATYNMLFTDGAAGVRTLIPTNNGRYGTMVSNGSGGTTFQPGQQPPDYSFDRDF
jgi:prepilin-type N-terminal cleavage/methylation domain-containing protein